MIKTLVIFAIIGLIAAFAMVQVYINFLPEVTGEDNSVPEKNKTGECMVWSNSSNEFIGIAALCADKEDCKNSLDSYNMYFVGDGSMSLDEKRLDCAPLEYQTMQGPSGSYSCNSSNDCLSVYQSHAEMRAAKLPDEMSEDLRELLKCEEGLCKAPAGVCKTWKN